MQRNTFGSFVAGSVRRNGKMTFSEIMAAALGFYDEAALLRRASPPVRSQSSATKLSCRLGKQLTEQQYACMIRAGAKVIASDLISKIRRKTMARRHPDLVVDDEKKEVRSELRQQMAADGDGD